MRARRKGIFATGHHDSNHAQIAAALSRFGPEPIDTTKVGRGFPDMVWPFQGETILIEIKTPDGTPTAAQVLFMREWRGGLVYTLTSPEEVPAMIERIQRDLASRRLNPRVIG